MSIFKSIGAFVATEAVDIEKDFANAGKAIGAFFKKEEPSIEPIIEAVLTDIAALKKQAATDIINAAIAAAKLLLNALIEEL